MQALDIVASALLNPRDWSRPRPYHINQSLQLADHLDPLLTPSLWRELENRLLCPLPPLQRHPLGLWKLPDIGQTVGDLARHVAIYRQATPPQSDSVSEWTESQIFVLVRNTLVEALNVDEDNVTRSARLIADLGAA